MTEQEVRDLNGSTFFSPSKEGVLSVSIQYKAELVDDQRWLTSTMGRIFEQWRTERTEAFPIKVKCYSVNGEPNVYCDNT